MDKERKINREATIEKILKKARGKIKDINAFNEKMKNDEFLKDSALYWQVEIIYH